jgi:hypothetical protein
MNPEWFIPNPDMNHTELSWSFRIRLRIGSYPQTRLSWLPRLTNCKCNMKDF